MAVPNYSIIGRPCAMNVTIGCRLCSAVSNQSSSGYAYFNVTVIRCQAEFWVCLLLCKRVRDYKRSDPPASVKKKLNNPYFALYKMLFLMFFLKMPRLFQVAHLELVHLH